MFIWTCDFFELDAWNKVRVNLSHTQVSPSALWSWQTAQVILNEILLSLCPPFLEPTYASLGWCGHIEMNTPKCLPKWTLVASCTSSQLRGNWFQRNISKQLASKHSGSIPALSNCLGGVIRHLLMPEQWQLEEGEEGCSIWIFVGEPIELWKGSLQELHSLLQLRL